MIVSLQTHRIRTVEDVRAFLVGNEATDFVLSDRESAYRFVRKTLVHFRYGRLARPDKGLIRRYLVKVTGKSLPQVSRLIRQYRETGFIRDRRGAPKHAFKRRYSKADIGLLAEFDAVFGYLCGHTTRALLRREFELYGNQRFQRLAYLSHGHLYNLRQSPTYRRRRTVFQNTRPTSIAIGERRKPQPRGRPGFVRVDTVHQGDLDGDKGVYHINLVDQVTQWQHVGATAAISERFLAPVLEAMIEAFPFRVRGFHADNGSEYINHRTAKMLNKLHVEEFTKSRPRRSNDNALVETKNGSVIRHHFGRRHIPTRLAREVNAFSRKVLSPFLNFHHPCMFATEVTDQNGRVRKSYRFQDVVTPFDRLKSIPGVERSLRPGVTIEQLEAEATAVSDLDAATALNEARRRLFEFIHKDIAAASIA